MKKKTVKVLKYTAVFEPDPKKGGYTVTIPALSGCISEGDTFEKALVNISEAAELYLEDLGEKEIPSESKPVIVAPIEIHL